jgi:hypothetical protein
LVAKQIERTEASTPPQAWWIGVVAWAVPGLGHFVQKRWGRGALVAVAVWGMFFAGLALGGHLFKISASDQGFSVLLSGLPMVANIGSGVLYIGCWLTNSGFAEQAQRVTYEYGNTFLLVAGLLNYLAMLDAFDIAAGRKR